MLPVPDHQRLTTGEGLSHLPPSTCQQTLHGPSRYTHLHASSLLVKAHAVTQSQGLELVKLKLDMIERSKRNTAGFVDLVRWALLKPSSFWWSWHRTKYKPFPIRKELAEAYLLIACICL